MSNNQEQQYHVRIRGPFTASHRVRAGVTVSVDDGYTGPLDAEQLKAIKADPNLTVTKGGAPADSVSADVKVTDAARQEASKIVSDAKAEAAKVVSDAKAEAKKLTDAAQKPAGPSNQNQ